jgi:hypothetical protein
MSAGNSVITDAADVTPNSLTSAFWLQAVNEKITAKTRVIPYVTIFFMAMPFFSKVRFGAGRHVPSGMRFLNSYSGTKNLSKVKTGLTPVSAKKKEPVYFF